MGPLRLGASGGKDARTGDAAFARDGAVLPPKESTGKPAVGRLVGATGGVARFGVFAINGVDSKAGVRGAGADATAGNCDEIGCAASALAVKGCGAAVANCDEIDGDGVAGSAPEVPIGG